MLARNAAVTHYKSMSPESARDILERQAQAAIKTYLRQPTTVPYGQLPLGRLRAWQADAGMRDGEFLSPTDQYIYGWLCLETAVSTVTSDKPIEEYLPEADIMFQKAYEIFKRMGRDKKLQVSDPLLYVQSLTALAGLVVPAYTIYPEDKIKPDHLINPYVLQQRAADILLTEFKKTGDRQLLHQLHVLSYTLLLNSLSDEPGALECFASPTSPRFELDPTSGHDLQLFVTDAAEFADEAITEASSILDQTVAVKISSDESPRQDGAIVLPPRLLLNASFSHGLGQGVMERLAEIASIDERGKPKKLAARRAKLVRELQPSLESAARYLREAIGTQEKPAPPEFTLPETPADIADAPESIAAWRQTVITQASTWYDNLPANYDFTTMTGQRSLQNCIDAYLATEDLTRLNSDEQERFAWLHAEQALVTGDTAMWSSAEAMFEFLRAQAGEVNDWPHYVQASLGAHNVRLWKELQAYGADDSDRESKHGNAAGTYQKALTELLAEIGSFFGDRSEKEIRRQYPQLVRTARQLAACLAINSSGYHTNYLAAMAWPRMTHDTELLGSHVLIMPLVYVDDGLPPVEGCVRVEGSSTATQIAAREQGIVDVAPTHCLPPSVEVADAASFLLDRLRQERSELSPRAQAVLAKIDEIGDDILARALDFKLV